MTQYLNGNYMNIILENQPIAEFTKLRVIDSSSIRVEESKNIVFILLY